MSDYERLRSVCMTNGDWVAVYMNLRAPHGVDPWTVEPVIAWAVVLVDGDTYRFKPVVGGESIEVSDEWIGVYRRADMARPDIRQRLIDTCAAARRHERMAMGYAAP